MDTPSNTVQGVLQRLPDGSGRLRDPRRSYQPRPDDVMVPASVIASARLREGQLVGGRVESGRLASAETIEGMPADTVRPGGFDELTPIDPTERVVLATGKEPWTTRLMDLFTPIGKGTRGLIVAPPKAGKTVLLHHVSRGVSVNHPEIHQMVLLVDERPEEVTEMRRSLSAEVIASSSDRDAASHVRTAELVIERAKRLAEMGRHVFILLDSLTRLARAYNKSTRDTGRSLSGGMDLKALEVSKRLFGAARCFEEGGSLTVLGTALIETGSRMDDVIFQEFKGTGNMELVLDRKLAERRVFPAMDVAQSGTRKEERLLRAQDLPRIQALRKALADMTTVQAMEALTKKIAASESNDQLLASVNVGGR
jgi:transcription termination factor Rho